MQLAIRASNGARVADAARSICHGVANGPSERETAGNDRDADNNQDKRVFGSRGAGFVPQERLQKGLHDVVPQKNPRTFAAEC